PGRARLRERLAQAPEHAVGYLGPIVLDPPRRGKRGRYRCADRRDRLEPWVERHAPAGRTALVDGQDDGVHSRASGTVLTWSPSVRYSLARLRYGTHLRAFGTVLTCAPSARYSLARLRHGTHLRAFGTTPPHAPAAPRTCLICSSIDGPPGSRPSKMAPPIVNPQAPAASR